MSMLTFMMTYGWALMILALAIGFAVYTGVFFALITLIILDQTPAYWILVTALTVTTISALLKLAVWIINFNRVNKDSKINPTDRKIFKSLFLRQFFFDITRAFFIPSFFAYITFNVIENKRFIGIIFLLIYLIFSVLHVISKLVINNSIKQLGSKKELREYLEEMKIRADDSDKSKSEAKCKSSKRKK
jgi:hypothetical protein